MSAREMRLRMPDEAWTKLQVMVESKGLNRGEVIARALAIYEFITNEMARDPEITICTVKAGHTILHQIEIR